VEYGEVTAEMLLLFTFVLFGSSLIWSGFTVLNAATIIFTILALAVRTPVYLFSLLGSEVDKRSRLLIAWFGPRGLSSLLLVLLPVFSGLPGSRHGFALCSLVVLVSIVLHGGSPLLLDRSARRRTRKESAETHTSEVARPFGPGSTGPSGQEKDDPAANDQNAPAVEAESDAPARVGAQQVSIEDLKRLRQSGDRVILLDVRKDRSLEGVTTQAEGSVRLSPDHAVERAKELGLPKEAWLIAYCT
jgi:NhaP-type Na+/H+ or K+/H+ antiporter